MKLKHPFQKLLLAGWLLVFTVTSSWAAGEFDRGLLWRIEKPGTAPAYLFGTMHIEDPDVVKLPAPVRQAFDRAQGVTLEVVLDPASLLTMTTAFLLTDGSTLESHIGPQLYQRSLKALAAHGLPEMMVSGMKPWAVAVTLMTPPSKTGEVLDLVLYQRALAAGKPVTGLETPMEQLAVFEAFSAQEQVQLLTDTLDQLNDIPQMMAKLKAAYLDRDLGRLVAISDQAMANNDPRLVEDFNRRLIVERNHRMVERMQPLLGKKEAFIAVGALHLPGEQGILKLLDDRGYRLTRVY